MLLKTSFAAWEAFLILFFNIKVLSQQMVTTPITELDSDIIQKDRGYEPDFSI